MKVAERKLRKMDAGLRRELLSYIPRYRLVGMTPGRLRMVLYGYGRADLYRRLIEELEREE